jgi:hypothetical protein
MAWRTWVWLGLLMAALALARPAWAGGETPCLQCHLAAPRQALGQLGWLGEPGGPDLGGCPVLAQIRRRLADTQALLLGRDQNLEAWSRRGFYTAPWRKGLEQARDQWRRVLDEPLESLGEATARMESVAAILESQVARPQRRAEVSASRRAWTGLMILGGLLLTLAWLVGYRRSLPQPPGREAFALVKAGRLP